MKKLCSKKESLKFEEKAYTQKCWYDGSLKTERDCWYCEGCDFYFYPNDEASHTFAPYGIEYPQNYTIDELHNMWIKSKKGEN